MKLKAKKQVNGKNVAIVDTQGADITSILDAMESNGWDFDIIRASYAAKDGTKKHKDIPISKVGAVCRKYNIDNWAIKAHKGHMAVMAQMSNSKGALVVKQSKGGALKEICSLNIALPASYGQENAEDAKGAQPAAVTGQPKHDKPAISSITAMEEGADDVEETIDIPAPKPQKHKKGTGTRREGSQDAQAAYAQVAQAAGEGAQAKGARAQAPQKEQASQMQRGRQDQATRQAAPTGQRQQAQRQEWAHQQARQSQQQLQPRQVRPQGTNTAPISDDPYARAPQMTQVQKEARRAAVRRDDNTQVKRVAKNKHILLLVISIISIFTPGIVFGCFSTWDTIQGRKLALENPAEAEKRFKLARFYLVLVLLCIVLSIVAWNLPAVIDWAKGAGILA